MGGALGIPQGGATHVAVLWHCMWRRGPKGNGATCFLLSQLSVTSSTTHKQIGPFWCIFLGGWVCVCSRTLWVSPMNSCVRLRVSPATVTPTGFFSIRGFEVLFPHNGTLGCTVCLSLNCSSQFIHTQMLDCPLCQLLPALVLHLPSCRESFLPWLLVSTPPTSLDECFFFTSLAVGLPYSWMFWKFWFFFFLICFCPSFVMWGGTVYLPMPPSWPAVFFSFLRFVLLYYF